MKTRARMARILRKHGAIGMLAVPGRYFYFQGEGMAVLVDNCPHSAMVITKAVPPHA